MAELKTRISLKYDTLEHWQKSTLGLNKGELAIVEIPTADPKNKQLPPVMFKVGVDGKKTFKELNWASALAADVYGWAKQSGITVGTSGTGNVVTGLSWDSANDRLLITKGDYVPSTRKVNNKALSADITLGAADVGVTETAFPGLNKVGTVTGVKMNDAAKTVGADGVVDLGTVITSHQDISGKQDKIKAGTHITIGTDGVTVNAAWPTDSDAGYAGINKTGTITGITMNGASKGTSGVVNLGTVLTEHQTIAEGATNGTISVAGTDVKVHGLGTAAYKAEGAFDAAGAANGVLGHSTDDATANTVYGAKAAAKAAQDTIDNYKTSNDAALAGVKATAEAAQTSAQVDAKISAHNSAADAHSDIRQSVTALAEKVSGRATNYVYKNDKDADYIAAVGKAGSFIVGDTIYFTDTNISDQWVIKVNATAPYYEFQDIETEKPSFDGYVKGTGLTADKLVLGNTGSNVKASTYGVSRALTASDDANLPTSKAVASYVTTQISAKQDNLSEEQLAAVNSGITKTKVSTYDGYATNKQDKLSADQLAAVNSGITADKVGIYDGYATGKQDKLNANQLSAVNSGITATKVEQYDGYATGKQDALSEAQLSAVNSGITAAKVGKYDGYETGKQDKIDTTHPLSADLVSGLGAAAKKGVASSVTAAGVDLPTAAAVATYVGGQLGNLDATKVSATAAQTISSIEQVNGKITIGAAQDIQIAQSQVTGLGTALGGKQDKLNANQLLAVNSGITAEKVSTYDGYATNKQDKLSADQLAAVNSGITADKVGIYDGYATGKQDALSEAQLAAVNSGITAEKVGKYDGYATSKQDKIDAANPLSADLVSGLGAAAKKGVDTAVSATSENLPTSKAVASYVGGEINKIVIPTVNNAALKDASDAIIFTANASADVKITVIDCGNASGWDA